MTYTASTASRRSCSRTTALCPGLSGQTASGPMVENGVFAKIRVRARSKGWLRGAPMFNAFLRGIPVLWGLGALTPTGAAMLVKLAIERWPRGALINFVVYSWIAIAVSAACAAHPQRNCDPRLRQGLRQRLWIGVVGWIFGALAIAAGAAHHLDDPKQSARRRGSADISSFSAPSPVSPKWLGCRQPSVMADANRNDTTQEFIGFLLHRDDDLPVRGDTGRGHNAAASLLPMDHRAWPRRSRDHVYQHAGRQPAVALDRRLRRSDCSCVQLELHRHRLTDRNGRTPGLSSFIVSGAARCARVIARRIFYSQSGNGFDPIEKIKQAQDSVNGARAGSSLARELIYERSWEGFLKSPIIGNGWIGELVHAKETLPIGSHSTIYGLAYTGGLPTLAAFVFAMSSTLLALAWRFLRLAYDDPRRSGALVGLGLGLCLAAYCRYEALFNLTLPCLFLFTWIGACLRSNEPVQSPAAGADERLGEFIRLRLPPAAHALGCHPLATRKSAFSMVKRFLGNRTKNDRYWKQVH